MYKVPCSHKTSSFFLLLNPIFSKNVSSVKECLLPTKNSYSKNWPTIETKKVTIFRPCCKQINVLYRYLACLWLCSFLRRRFFLNVNFAVNGSPLLFRAGFIFLRRFWLKDNLFDVILGNALVCRFSALNLTLLPPVSFHLFDELVALQLRVCFLLNSLFCVFFFLGKSFFFCHELLLG